MKKSWYFCRHLHPLCSFLSSLFRGFECETCVMLSRLASEAEAALWVRREISEDIKRRKRNFRFLTLPSSLVRCSLWIWQPPAFAITLACRSWKMAAGLAYTLHKFRHKLEIVVTFMAWKPIVMRIASSFPCEAAEAAATFRGRLGNAACHTIFSTEKLPTSLALHERTAA